MKDLTRKEWENGSLPLYDAICLIRFCLDHLYADKNLECSDTLANNRLTYEELIGTLVSARVSLEMLDTWLSDHEEKKGEDRPYPGYFIECVNHGLEKKFFYPNGWPKHEAELEWREKEREKKDTKYTQESSS